MAPTRRRSRRRWGVGEDARSRSNTRLSSRAQLSRIGRWCAHFASHSAGGAAWAGPCGSCGTTCARSLAFGANTPWKRIRCSLGLGTEAASRCMNSSGDSRVQAETLHVGAQGLIEVRLPGYRALHRQHPLAAVARAEGDAVSRARTQAVQWTVCAWRGAGPLAGAACRASWSAQVPRRRPVHHLTIGAADLPHHRTLPVSLARQAS